MRMVLKLVLGHVVFVVVVDFLRQVFGAGLEGAVALHEQPHGVADGLEFVGLAVDEVLVQAALQPRQAQYALAHHTAVRVELYVVVQLFQQQFYHCHAFNADLLRVAEFIPEFFFECLYFEFRDWVR